jgi:hypothetical protein
MTPTKLTLIPHDGGACPVDVACKGFFVKYRNGSFGYEKVNYCTPNRYPWNWKNRSIGWVYGDDIIACCPIEIEEERK